MVALEPAALAAAPECAEVSVRLPQAIGELDRRETNAQATAAWGAPVAVLLRCGLEPVAVSDDPCLEVEDLEVAWLVDESAAPDYRFTSYGRAPAVEVIVDSTRVSGQSALSSLDIAVAALPLDGRVCVDAPPAPAG